MSLHAAETCPEMEAVLPKGRVHQRMFVGGRVTHWTNEGVVPLTTNRASYWRHGSQTCRPTGPGPFKTPVWDRYVYHLSLGPLKELNTHNVDASAIIYVAARWRECILLSVPLCIIYIYIHVCFWLYVLSTSLDAMLTHCVSMC